MMMISPAGAGLAEPESTRRSGTAGPHRACRRGSACRRQACRPAPRLGRGGGIGRDDGRRLDIVAGGDRRFRHAENAGNQVGGGDVVRRDDDLRLRVVAGVRQVDRCRAREAVALDHVEHARSEPRDQRAIEDRDRGVVARVSQRGHRRDDLLARELGHDVADHRPVALEIELVRLPGDQGGVERELLDLRLVDLGRQPGKL